MDDDFRLQKNQTMVQFFSKIGYGNKGIHLYLPPTLWAEFLSQCEDISLIIWFSGLELIWSILEKNFSLGYLQKKS